MQVIYFLNYSPLFFLSFIFVLGLTVGSFLNVVIYRYPIMLKSRWKSECKEFLAEQSEPNDVQLAPEQISAQERQPEFNLATPRSRCPHCGHQITALENIPIISWLVLRAKCSHCKGGISGRYPLVELFTGIISVTIGYFFGVTILMLALLFFSWSLIALSLIDFDTQLLPDDITLPLLWAGLLASLLGISSVSPVDSLIGVMAGYFSLWSVFHLFKLITGKEGMGYGDFKLLAALGAWLGWQMLPVVLFLSAIVGSIVGISLILFLGRDKNIPIPFGPYLAAAGFIALIWGRQLTDLYIATTGMG